ncbi:hypothetical protein WEB32_29685 [Streptomyces netropsis]|uniref:phage tail protein n=1 Tax=Streptomyces netropsis TaxID=55404 RepID=UPI0030CFCCEF
MAGPGGQERGRIAIRVLPDTSNFAVSLQRYLDRIERRARVQVQAVPDLNGFRERLAAQLARVRARVRVDVDPDLSNFRDTLRGRLQGANAALGVRLEVDEREIARLRRELAHITPPITIPARIDADRDSLAGLSQRLGSMGRDGNGAARGVLAVVGSLGRLATMASAIPVAAGIGSSIAAMAPAAAVAAPAILAMASAGAALKIGMSGVKDALKGDAEAMAKLAPSARDFVTQAKALAPAWDGVKRSVQGALFKDLGDTLTRTASSVLPVLKTQLTGTASALNLMGRDVLNTATGLSKSGALGQALGSATTGLKNLSALPAVMLQGLVQLGAAAGPTFDRMTARMGKGLEGLSERMAATFKSGAMQRSIESAVQVAKTFGGIISNVAATLSNVFGPAVAAGGGALQVLSDMAAMAAKVTATPEAQATFTALFQTVAAVGGAVSQILGAALQAVMPLLNILVTTLAGPLQGAVRTIGPAFAQLATSLGTALVPVVKVVSQALAAILPIAANLIAQLASGLGPVLVAVGALLGRIGQILLTALQPILAQLPGILAPILAVVQQLLPIFVQIANQLITALAPSIIKIGAAFGELLVAVGPLITAVGQFLAGAFRALMPVITVVIGIVARIAAVFADFAARYIRTIVIPAIQMIVKLFRGDFSGALNAAKAVVSNFGALIGAVFSKIRSVVSAGVSAVISYFATMASRAWSHVVSMGSNIASAARLGMSSMGSSISSGVGSAVGFLRGLPSRAASAVGNLGHVLIGAGRSLIQGFINGIQGMVGSLRSKLGEITGMLPDWKGPAKLDARILTPNGRLLMEGFMDGIQDRVPTLRRQLGGITGELPVMAGSQAVVAQAATVRPGPSWGGGAAINIDHFHAGDMEPAQVARELDWLMKARG